MHEAAKDHEDRSVQNDFVALRVFVTQAARDAYRGSSRRCPMAPCSISLRSIRIFLYRTALQSASASS